MNLLQKAEHNRQMEMGQRNHKYISNNLINQNTYLGRYLRKGKNQISTG